VNEGREATIFRLQLAKILKSQNVVPLLITFIEKIENADFWEILSGQDVIRRTHQLAVAVCRGERDALPSAHTSPDRGCTFSKVLSTVIKKYSTEVLSTVTLHAIYARRGKFSSDFTLVHVPGHSLLKISARQAIPRRRRRVVGDALGDKVSKDPHRRAVEKARREDMKKLVSSL
jgi:hypothetical protein